jgi:thiol-disulfide isomerase/thioredoxin
MSTTNIKTVLYDRVEPYLKPALIVGLIVLFSVVAYYGYQSFYAKPKSKQDIKNVANSTYDKTIYIHYFHVEWCPHCKKADPEWDTFTSQFDNKVINGYTIKCINNDCTNDEDDSIADLLQRYEIDSFPTIKMEKDGNVIDFDARITSSALGKFVDSVVK